MDEQNKWKSLLIEAKNIPKIKWWQYSGAKDSCQNNYFLLDNECLALELKLPY